MCSLGGNSKPKAPPKFKDISGSFMALTKAKGPVKSYFNRGVSI